jgi:peptidyl-prolyl cis-trans isomerase D
MLEQIRKHMGWMMWVIVGLITVTFLFFGIYPSNVGGTRAAKVGDTVITTDEVNRAYRNLYDNYKEVLKDQFNDSFAKSLKAQALQQLIVNRLLISEAERLGLQVSDEELQASIIKMPAFSANGKFDKRVYDRILDRVNMTPAAFETSQREMLLRQKMEYLIRDGVSISEAELTVAYKQQNPKAKPGDFEKNRDSFAQTYLAGKQRDALTASLREIEKKIPVVIDEKSVAQL